MSIAGDRTIKVFVGGGGSTQVIVDVTGYYTAPVPAPKHGQLTRRTLVQSSTTVAPGHPLVQSGRITICASTSTFSRVTLTEASPSSRTDGLSAGALDVSGDEVLQLLLVARGAGRFAGVIARSCRSASVAPPLIDVPSSPDQPA